MADSGGPALALAATSITDAVHAMLPNLRMILSAVIATCAVVLAASAGFIGSRDPSRGFADVPEVSRPLMQTAIMEEPEWQHFQLLAYARRADELQRLLELPVTPARAVVEIPEHAEPAEPVIANVPTLAEPEEESGTVRVALQHDPVAAPAAAPAVVEADPADAPAPVALPSEPSAAAEAIPTEPAAPAPQTRLANVQPGSAQTAAVRPPPKKLKIVASPTAKTKVAKAAPRKKNKKKPVRVARAVRRAPPAASTGFPVELPTQTNQNAALFNDQRVPTRATQKSQDTTEYNQRDR